MNMRSRATVNTEVAIVFATRADAVERNFMKRRTLLFAGAARVLWTQSRQYFLESISISFDTLDDDKDWDSKVRVGVKVPNFYDYINLPMKHFPNGSHNGPFVVAKFDNGKGPQSNPNQGADVDFVFRSYGNDTWRFNFSVRIAYTDGSWWSSGYNNCMLSSTGNDVDLRGHIDPERPFAGVSITTGASGRGRLA